MLVFLALAGGYALGRVKIKGFGIGTTASVLLVAMVLGQCGVAARPYSRASLRAVRLMIGTRSAAILRGAEEGGVNYLPCRCRCRAGLATAVELGKALHFDKGTTDGLFRRDDAIRRHREADGAVGNQLAISSRRRDALRQHRRLIRLHVLLAWWASSSSQAAPPALRDPVSGKKRTLEESMGRGSDFESPSLFSWSRQVGAFAVEASGRRSSGRRWGR